ncbi:MAG: hypothetical protein JSU63_18375 [Phycisphaerales bacterium]|nr:MAG: hypothetical protein JSU63_18375 [Phycisphaerales bacterium]
MDEEQQTTAKQEAPGSGGWIRVVILLLIVVALAGLWAMRRAAPPAQPKFEPQLVGERPDPGELVLLVQLEDPPGEEPEGPPSFDVSFEVDRSTAKNRLVFYIQETHGYYVESPVLEFWWHEVGEDPDTDGLPEPYPIEWRINNYIEANKTYKDCITITNPELEPIGGDMGSAENWSGRITDYHHVRTADPDPPRPRPMVGRECS